MKNKTLWGLLTLIVVLIAGTIFVLTTETGNKVINYFRGSDEVEQSVTDTTTTVSEQYTIQDVLDMREQEREYRYLDSTYMDIPDIPLIAILMRFGTDMSHTDIAKEYLANKANYDNVEFGAQIRDAYRQQTNRANHDPDKMPEVATPDTVLPNQ